MSPVTSVDPVPQSAPMQARAFEGLFLRGLEPTPALLAALREAGYDPLAPKKSYPSQVWRDCIEAARKQVYPHLAVEDGQRRLGAHFVEGIAKTIVGSVLAASAPLLGPERTLDRIGSYMRIAHQASEVTMVSTGPRRRKVLVRAQRAMPHFFAGALEAVLRLTRVEPDCQLVTGDDEGFEAVVSWK